MTVSELKMDMALYKDRTATSFMSNKKITAIPMKKTTQVQRFLRVFAIVLPRLPDFIIGGLWLGSLVAYRTIDSLHRTHRFSSGNPLRITPTIVGIVQLVSHDK